MSCYSKKWREKKVEQGLCWTCGKNPHIIDRRECKSCQNKRRERQKKDYYSATHSKTKEAVRKRRAKFKEVGLCTRCGKNESGNLLTCKECLSIQSRRVKELKDQVFNHYGGYQCTCCGEDTKEFMMLDHINNDGAEHRRSIGKSSGSGGRGFYLWIIRNNFPKIFQVLCANCNWGKKMNNGVCPHKND